MVEIRMGLLDNGGPRRVSATNLAKRWPAFPDSVNLSLDGWQMNTVTHPVSHRRAPCTLACPTSAHIACDTAWFELQRAPAATTPIPDHPTIPILAIEAFHNTLLRSGFFGLMQRPQSWSGITSASFEAGVAATRGPRMRRRDRCMSSRTTS